MDVGVINVIVDIIIDRIYEFFVLFIIRDFINFVVGDKFYDIKN